MVLSKDEYKTTKEFYITFSQEEFSPADPTNPCLNYPTVEYESYAECDDHFVTRSLPPSLKPFWAVDNLSEASNTFSLETETWKNMEKLDDLFSGILPSDCLRPCLQTTATVEEGTVSSFEQSMISLAFSDEVCVKKTSVDKFSFMDSLNYFGSNLGLWPGLGLYQVLELVVGLVVASKVCNKIVIFFQTNK